MSTLSDIAKKAGCSVNLVSYVLKKTEPPVKERHKRILEIAGELNYVTNRTASALITGRTNNITLLTGDLYGTLKQLFFVEFLDALTRRLSEKSMGLVLQHTFGNDVAHLKKIVLSGGSDGIIWYASDVPEEIEDILLSRGIPSISLLSKTEKTSCLTIDDYHSVYNAMEYLYGCGHRRIVFCGNDKNPRYFAYRDFATQKGLSLVKNMEFSEFDIKNTAIVKGYLQKSGLDFTALMCERDVVAISAIYVLKDMGISVPGQVSVVGYDDLPESEACVPRLTTVHHNYIEMVDKTVSYLLSAIAGKNQGKLLRENFVHNLIVRDSVKKI